MIKDGVIVDTSVLIEFLKGSEKIAKEVTTLIQSNRIVSTGIIIAELMQGIKKPNEEERIAELLMGVNILEIPTPLWIKAGKLSSSLRRKGINLPLTDTVIAILALENDLTLFTFDKHFTRIPNLKIYKE
jgi:predicted nucleic acid-binding protein